VIQAGVATALAAALVFGVYLYVYKRSFDALPATVYTAVNEVAGFLWYLPIAALTWPTGEAVVPAATTAADVLLLCGVGVAIAAANLVSVRAFKLGDVSYIAPLNKLVPVFVLPVELLVLRTELGALQVLGVLLAGVAIYVANYETASVLAPLRRVVAYRPAQLALLGAVLFAVADVGVRAVLLTTPLPAQTVALFSFVAVAAVALPLALPRVRWTRLRPALPGTVALSAVFAVGVHLATVSFDAAPASVVSPLVNTQAVVAVLLGSVLLDEGLLGRRLTAAVVAVAGIALVASG
jgi:drug/metabolite transporter (DMT)-like permease